MSPQFKTLTIIHLSLVAGLVLAYGFIGDLHTLAWLKLPEFSSHTLVFMAVPLVAVVMSKMLYRQVMQQINKNASKTEQFAQYQTAKLVCWSIVEGAALLLLLFSAELIVLGILLIGYLIYLRPSEDEMKEDISI